MVGTPLGEVTTNFTKRYFPEIIDYEFTAQMEESLDSIARDENTIEGVISGFYHKFKEELTGPEYAYRYEKKVKELNIEFKLNTMVLDITPDKVVTATNTEDGIFMIQAKAIILAMGCRERPKGALNIAGDRPAGIYSAGMAQKLVNMKGYMPGKKVVILGSDIILKNLNLHSGCIRTRN